MLNADYIWGLLLFIAAPFLLLPVSSCQTEDCVSLSNNDLLVSFYESDSTELKEVAFNFVKALKNDSIFYTSEDKGSDYKLPLNPAEDITTFIFQAIDSVTYDTLQLDPILIDTIIHQREKFDTLELSYLRTQRIITVDCGVEISYTIDTININTFSGYTIENKQLSRINTVNVKVYY